MIVWLWIGGGMMAHRHVAGRVPRQAPAAAASPVSRPCRSSEPVRRAADGARDVDELTNPDASGAAGASRRSSPSRSRRDRLRCSSCCASSDSRRRDRRSSPLIGRPAPRASSTDDDRAVRPLPPQGQLGGLQLLRPHLRAVRRRAPRTGRVRRAAGAPAPTAPSCTPSCSRQTTRRRSARSSPSTAATGRSSATPTVDLRRVRRVAGARDVDHRPRRCGPRPVGRRDRRGRSVVNWCSSGAHLRHP